MRDFGNILGNGELCSRLSEDIRRGSLAHAYIIEGAEGCGKHTLAREIAAALACENSGKSGEVLPCGKCLSCRKILSGKSPDVITVSREEGKAQLGVDVIRHMREDVVILPNDLDIKVYIVEDAHLMNVQAQNAFLLTLEEPPGYVVFLLLANSSKTLLETVKSRAPVLRMTPLPADTLRRELISKNEDASALAEEAPDELDEIIKLSSGYMGGAIRLLDKKTREPLLAARRLAIEFISALTLRRQGRRSVELIMKLSQKRDGLSEELSQTENAVRDLILIKRCEEPPLCFFTSEDDAFELSRKFKTADLLKLMEAIGKAKASLSANGNVRLTLFALAIDCGLL